MSGIVETAKKIKVLTYLLKKGSGFMFSQKEVQEIFTDSKKFALILRKAETFLEVKTAVSASLSIN